MTWGIHSGVLMCFGCGIERPRSWFVVAGRRSASQTCETCRARARLAEQIKARAAREAREESKVVRVGYGPVLGYAVRLDNIRYTTADRARQAMELYRGGSGVCKT